MLIHCELDVEVEWRGWIFVGGDCKRGSCGGYWLWMKKWILVEDECRKSSCGRCWIFKRVFKND
jgi:hypothetical protein